MPNVDGFYTQWTKMLIHNNISKFKFLFWKAIIGNQDVHILYSSLFTPMTVINQLLTKIVQTAWSPVITACYEAFYLTDKIQEILLIHQTDKVKVGMRKVVFWLLEFVKGCLYFHHDIVSLLRLLNVCFDGLFLCYMNHSLVIYSSAGCFIWLRVAFPAQFWITWWWSDLQIRWLVAGPKKIKSFKLKIYKICFSHISDGRRQKGYVPFYIPLYLQQQ